MVDGSGDKRTPITSRYRIISFWPLIVTLYGDLRASTVRSPDVDDGEVMSATNRIFLQVYRILANPSSSTEIFELHKCDLQSGWWRDHGSNP